MKALEKMYYWIQDHVNGKILHFILGIIATLIGYGIAWVITHLRPVLGFEPGQIGYLMCFIAAWVGVIVVITTELAQWDVLRGEFDWNDAGLDILFGIFGILGIIMLVG